MVLQETVLRVPRVLQVLRSFGRPFSLVDGLVLEVGPLVAVATGLSGQASDGRWKSYLFYPQFVR